jgi:glutaconate CoA-transferase subunit B
VPCLHLGVTVEEVQANSGFEILIPDGLTTTQPPSREELAALAQIDPTRGVLGK